MFYLAKLIQAVGFADVTYALFVGFTEEHSMGRELTLMMIGAAIFYVGWFLERKVSV
jgi:ammonia channel protein AmtB